MKKICIIASSPKGIRSFWRTNVEKIATQYDVYIVANIDGNNKDDLSDLKIKGVKNISIERRPSIIKDIKAVWALYRYFRRMQFDAFISMSSKASLISSLAGFLAHIHIRIRIFTGQIWANKRGFSRLFYKFIDNITVFLNTDICVDSKSQREFLVDNGILKRDKAVVLANGSICGVDIDRFKPNPILRTEERNKFGIKDNEIVFAFMGRVNRDKGIYELLKAFDKLCKQYNETRLVMIGNTEGILECEFSLYQNIKVNQNLILYGYTSFPERALQIADVFCLPSYREGFGMSVIEAASIGLPVICSDAYGLRDSFVNDKTGLMCRVADVDTLYWCMLEYYLHKEKRITHGNNGRVRVMNDFSMELVSNAWLNYFKDLLR